VGKRYREDRDVREDEELHDGGGGRNETKEANGAKHGIKPGSCLVHPKIKNFSRFLITSNLTAHVWSIKYR